MQRCEWSKPLYPFILMSGITIQTSNTLRGIAILLVMLNHVIGKSGGAGTLYGAMGVSLFFFLSGFGLQKSYEKKAEKAFGRKKQNECGFPTCFCRFQ